jgi:hypothetical protein
MVDLIPKGNIPGTSGIIDSLLLGSIKVIEERALAPMIGDGTTKSGIIKIFGGSIADSMIPGKAGKLVGGALIIDGVEDIVNGIVTPRLYGSQNSGEENW